MSTPLRERTDAINILEKQQVLQSPTIHKPTQTVPLKQDKLTELPTDYQAFIHASRYARWIPEKQRRETWPETVSRYFDFMTQHLFTNYNFQLTHELRTELETAVLDLQIMPSMRALMTAGEALERCHVAGYNCSYLPIDHVYAFDEILFILMNGTGAGFSVEKQYVCKLPKIAEDVVQSDEVVVVEDNREGWASALRKILTNLYQGKIIKWDTKNIRPKGARLNTFGGRASGPGPLIDLFQFAKELFIGAKGRQLTALECHDLVCKVAEVVVCGGVRRSALISLSDLDDTKMRSAKSYEWWNDAPYRAIANNSAVYTSKPTMNVFLEEWLSLYKSRSGERGIFSRTAAKNQVEKTSRRNSGFDFGTNPCSEIILRPFQFCNLTEVVVRSNDTQESLLKKVELATILGTFQASLTRFPYLREIWRETTEDERLLGVSLTGILDNQLLNLANGSNASLKHTLLTLKKKAVQVNKTYAEKLGIKQSAAMTCVKPSGTVSQLVDAASGIHPRHSQYYIRRVQCNKNDPLKSFMESRGVPVEDCVGKEDTTSVFSFPMKSPEGALTRDDLTAIEQLELCLLYQKYWCEHKPSVTITVREDEWMQVGAWVYDHFEVLAGVSFLPYDGGNYKQMPYEKIEVHEYEQLAQKMPVKIDWRDLEERMDDGKCEFELACTADGCEAVDVL